MFNFLHTFSPQPIIASLGPINVYWYGVLMVTSILAALAITLYLARIYQINREQIFDLSFWLIIGGLVGARIYDVFLQLPYYLRFPGQIIKIWEGGLSIHGAIIAGLIVLAIWARRYKLNFWKLSALLVPGLALGQAIGRWGNYFNQELFGLPTTGNIGIPISLINRPIDYLNYSYFQPTFLYESLGCFIIFLILISLIIASRRKTDLGTKLYVLITALYMILYSILRFFLEFIKINQTPTMLGLRWPQIISLIIIVIFSFILLTKNHAYQNQKKQLSEKS